MSADVTAPAGAQDASPAHHHPPRSTRRALRGTLGLLLSSSLLIALSVGVWLMAGPNPVSSRVLGIPNVAFGRLPQAVAVTLSARGGTFNPRAVVVVHGGAVSFNNQLGTPIEIQSAARSPAAFTLRLAAHARATIHLTHLGLYHYYDALTARPVGVVANNEVLNSLVGPRPPREGWIAVLPAMPGLATHLTVPAAHDLFAPKALVTVVGARIVVENHDSDAHNFVIDPASPSGAAFIVNGSSAEPPVGWQRVLVVQQAGLYHVYCTMHTRVVGVVDGWHVVVPRPSASGYHDHNPMEAWVIALPATTS